MVEDGIDIRWKNRTIGIVYLHGRVGPPKESLWYIGTVEEFALYLKVCTTRTESETCSTLLMEHLLLLIHPNSDTTILVLHDTAIHRQIGGWTVVLWPVELNATTDPWSCETYKSRFDDMIIIDKVALANLIVCHLYTTTKLWKNHDFDVLILYPDGFPFVVCWLIRDFLYYRVWIYYTT